MPGILSKQIVATGADEIDEIMSMGSKYLAPSRIRN